VFRKGDTVVHPEHGAAVIEELCVREFLGEKRRYFKLRVSYGDLTLMVPVDSTEEVGLRSVVGKNEVKKVLARAPRGRVEDGGQLEPALQEQHREAALGRHLPGRRGRRNLSIRERERGLSAGEKRMINKARQILISELTVRHRRRRGEGRGHDRQGAGRVARRRVMAEASGRAR
jgi:CarD family transcriptional regulator